MSKPVVSRYIPQLPDGWVKCPRFGDPRFFEGLNIIPCKVPLSRKFDSQIKSISGRWTLADAIRQFRGYGMEVATIIDLTKSHNYYDVGRELEELGYPQIRYYKIECRGRGESPKPSEVNEAVWHIYMHQMDPDTRDKYILLHCTHGYNRTGFVAVAAMMRLRRDRGMSVFRALQRFAGSRPPGIYKDHYINDLFKYYHEARDVRFLTPSVPAWKGNDDAEDAADAANEDGGVANEDGKAPEAPAAPIINHEDIWSIGEKVCMDEATFVKQQVCNLLSFDGGGGGGGGRQMRFPGMQPVSLALERLPDLVNNRYWATWKADGTRYMVLILQHGTYIMDRSFNVVRCEMRFQCGLKRPPPGQKPHYAVGKAHHLTLLDGEMVLDHDPEGKVPPRLRYLIYDCCMINAIPLVGKPWKERYRAIESDIINPRAAERDYIERWRGRPWDPARGEYATPPYNYNYGAEPFSVRRKPFWTVGQIDKVFERFHDPSKIGHESDGVILQGYEHLYTPGTCELLYKWKYAHMNSVDFLLRCATKPGPDGAPVLDAGAPQPLQLFLLDQATSRGGRINYVALARADPDGHFRMEFPAGVDPLEYNNKLVECTFDRDRGVWLFMRERKDKDTPNGSKVYLRIKESIINHVDQELLVGTLKDALLNTRQYENDRGGLSADQQVALRQDVDAWHRKMQEREQLQQAHRGQAPPGAHEWPQGHGDGGAHMSPGEPHGNGSDDDQGHGGGGGGGGGGGAYCVSEADAEGRHRLGEDGEEGDGGLEAPPGQRLTRWGPEADEPHPQCPSYEGYGFGSECRS